MTVIRADVLACFFMNILIEDAESLQYLTSENKWTKNPVEGRDFGMTGNAADFAKKEPIGKFNIVAYISATRQFINMDHGRGKGIPEISPA